MNLGEYIKAHGIKAVAKPRPLPKPAPIEPALPRKKNWWYTKRANTFAHEPGAGNGLRARPEGTYVCGSCWGDGWVHVDEGTLILYRGLLIPVGICPRCDGSGRVKA